MSGGARAAGAASRWASPGASVWAVGCLERPCVCVCVCVAVYTSTYRRRAHVGVRRCDVLRDVLCRIAPRRRREEWRECGARHDGASVHGGHEDELGT